VWGGCLRWGLFLLWGVDVKIVSVYIKIENKGEVRIWGSKKRVGKWVLFFGG